MVRPIMNDTKVKINESATVLKTRHAIVEVEYLAQRTVPYANAAMIAGNKRKTTAD